MEGWKKEAISAGDFANQHMRAPSPCGLLANRPNLGTEHGPCFRLSPSFFFILLLSLAALPPQQQPLSRFCCTFAAPRSLSPASPRTAQRHPHPTPTPTPYPTPAPQVHFRWPADWILSPPPQAGPPLTLSHRQNEVLLHHPRLRVLLGRGLHQQLAQILSLEREDAPCHRRRHPFAPCRPYHRHCESLPISRALASIFLEESRADPIATSSSAPSVSSPASNPRPNGSRPSSAARRCRTCTRRRTSTPRAKRSP